MEIVNQNLNRAESGLSLDLKRSPFREQVCQVGVLLSIATGFTIPVSTSLTSILSIVIVICWLISGQYRVSLELMKRNRLIIAALAFFSFLAVGLLYTPESWLAASRNLFKYRQFLLMPVYLSFFLDPKSRQRGIQMFELALVLTLIGSIYYSFLPVVTVDGDIYNRAVFKNRITQNILMSFLVYLAAWKFWEQPKQRWYYGVLAFVATYNIVAMVPGRSGYVALVILIFLLMYQKMGVRGVFPAIVCIGLVGLLGYSQSETFQGRINQVVTEVNEYGGSEECKNGVDLRLEFYENSFVLAKSNPILGSGSGSFAPRYRQLAEKKQQLATANPHNEYIMLLVQNGLAGVGLFLAFFGVAWKATRTMSGLDRGFGQAVLAVYLIVCLVNSLMLDTTEGNLFGFMVALTMAGSASFQADQSSAEEPDLSTDATEAAPIQNAA